MFNNILRHSCLYGFNFFYEYLNLAWGLAMKRTRCLKQYFISQLEKVFIFSFHDHNSCCYYTISLLICCAVSGYVKCVWFNSVNGYEWLLTQIFRILTELLRKQSDISQTNNLKLINMWCYFLSTTILL